jgi:hypothetical protein
MGLPLDFEFKWRLEILDFECRFEFEVCSAGDIKMMQTSNSRHSRLSEFVGLSKHLFSGLEALARSRIFSVEDLPWNV